MSRLWALALTAGALVSAASSASESTCNEWAPCYREGYCDANAMFCMWDLCDATKSYNSTSCWKPEGCLGQTVNFDSSSDVVPVKQFSGNPNTNAFVSVFEPDNTKIEDGKLVLDMTYDSAQKKGFGATVHASHTIQYGTVTARIKTAAIAKGVVSAFIIRSDQVGDEIDFEWVGKEPNTVETNFFYHDILNYSNSKYFDIGGDSSADYHDYTIVWDPDFISWAVDGKTLRTLKREDTYNKSAKEYRFPAAEGRVGLSIWDGGNSGAEGTEEWAGTPTPWTDSTVYQMFVDSITIKCSGSDLANSESDTVEPASSDSQQTSDAGSSDAGSSDAGSSDAEASDEGSSDATPSDDGSSDDGSSDAASSDDDASDAGSSDAGASSAESSDNGASDGESSDYSAEPTSDDSQEPSGTEGSGEQSSTDSPVEPSPGTGKCKVVTVVRPIQ